MLLEDHVAIYLDLEECVQFCHSQNGAAILARGHNSYFKPEVAQPMEELDAARVRRYTIVFDYLVDQIILPVVEALTVSDCEELLGLPSVSWISRDARKSRTSLNRGFPST